MALRFPDPFHSVEENREITIGYTLAVERLFLWPTVSVVIGYESLARERRPNESEDNMKKGSQKTSDNDLRQEYDLSKLKGGIRGKYYRKAVAGTNLMLIEPELAEIFPDAESVNRALRVLADAAEASAAPARRRRNAGNKSIDPSPRKTRRG